MASSAHRLGANFRDTIVKIAALRLSDATSRDTAAYAEIITGSGVPSGAYGRASGVTMLYLRQDASDGDTCLYITWNAGTTWEALADSTAFSGTLASTSNGEGASLIGIEDAAASLAGATVEAALAELATPISLSAGAEAADNIVVTVAGVAQVAQYIARVYDAAGLLAESTAFTIAETGAGAEVSTTAKASLIFTTSAAGAASLTVHDVAGASGASLFLEVSPFSVQAGAKASPTGVLAITFDGS